MAEKIRSLAKAVMPPVLADMARNIKPRQFSRPYSSYEEARAASTGYDSEAIVDTVAASMLRVVEGEIAYERDGVAFSEVQYSWPLLAGLMWIAARERRLRICDFGGALGTTYVQNRKFFTDFETTYSIVEQPVFADRGRRLFQGDVLKFYTSLGAALKERPSDVLLLSGVLSHLPDPYGALDELLGAGLAYVVIDRTPLLEAEEDRVTVQTVPRSVYQASYPAWFLSESKLHARLTRDYRIVESFRSFERWDLGDTTAQSYGFILEHKDRS